MTPMTRGIGVLAVLAALALAGCGSSSSSGGSGASGSGSSSSSTSSGGSGGGHDLKLAADPSGQLKFDATQLKATAGTVTIHFTNMSATSHAVAVEGNGVDKDGKVVTNGSNTLTLTLKKGTYTFYCPVDGHRAAGMQGKLIVN